MKKSLLFSLFMILLACGVVADNPEISTVTLVSQSIDDYDLMLMGAVIGPRGERWPFDEKIIRYPDNVTVKYAYNACLHQKDDMYKKFLADSAEREKFFAYFKDETFEDWQSIYTKDSVDHFRSFCTVEDSAGKEWVIFDENNDEDLSNDEAKSFGNKKFIIGVDTFENIYADGNAEFEYYDGEKVQTSSCGIRIFRGKKFSGNTFAMLMVHGRFGQWKVNGESFTIGVTNFPEVEYSKYNQLWIDLNHNGKYDREGGDYYNQLYLPFTLGKRAYGLQKIDRFGKSVTLRSFDPDSVPPIGLGLPAPDFTETALDSSKLRLSDFARKGIILDFWTCNANNGVLFSNDIYKKVKEIDRIQLISFGPSLPQFMSQQAKEITIEWPHVNGLFEIKTRQLYQVGAGHTTIGIDSSGMIVFMKERPKETEIDSLIAALNE